MPIEEYFDRFQHEVLTWKWNPDKMRVPNKLAMNVLREVSTMKADFEDGVSQDSRKNRLIKSYDLGDLPLPSEFKKELLNFYACAAELLRHFWSCYSTPFPPATSIQKAGRILKVLENVKERIQAFAESLPPQTRQYRYLLRNVQNPITVAISKQNQFSNKVS